MDVSGYGLRVSPGEGWHVAITRRAPAAGSPGAASVMARDAGRAAAVPAGAVGEVDAAGLRWHSGEITYPVLHAATVPLPAARGDFGTGVVDLLTAGDVFVALIEYGSEVADQGLFARQGMPRLAPSQFSPHRLQRVFGGRSAAQHFFSESGRAFCLFAVVGSHATRMRTVPRAAALTRAVHVTDRRTLLARTAEGAPR